LEVTSYAADLGVARNIEFRFDASSDEVLRLLASSKAFVYLTRFDAFPLVVLESLSCGTPSLPTIYLPLGSTTLAQGR